MISGVKDIRARMASVRDTRKITNAMYLIASAKLRKAREDARRIASKYAATVIRNFQKTRNLWEKYNVVEGNINVSNEYEMPTMVGWTAGTFVFATDYLDRTAR